MTERDELMKEVPVNVPERSVSILAEELSNTLIETVKHLCGGSAEDSAPVISLVSVILAATAIANSEEDPLEASVAYGQAIFKTVEANIADLKAELPNG